RSTSTKLVRQTRQRIQSAIDRSLADDGPAKTSMLILQGLLREIDLDSHTLRIHEIETGKNIKCAIPLSAEDLLSIAKQALDHEVIVRGKAIRGRGKQKGATLEIREIEEIEASNEDISPNE
ncbi:MAG: hypothetical protein ACREDR_11185, partial [Blastocatellia bacterium]